MRTFLPVPINQRFGRLLVLRQATPPPGNGNRFVECLCDCGRTSVIRLTYLRNGHASSCGCQGRERAQAAAVVALTTHGRSKTPEFSAWSSMKTRCSCTTNANFSDYGGRGIRVCDRWRDSFEAFLADMGPRPSPLHSIDRIDNDGNYEPGNVRWATSKQQMWNQRCTDRIAYRGETLPLNEWAKRLGLSQGTLRRRLRELGWSVERAMETATTLYHHRSPD